MIRKYKSRIFMGAVDDRCLNLVTCGIRLCTVAVETKCSVLFLPHYLLVRDQDPLEGI